jgi:predicted transcriptional regulator
MSLSTTFTLDDETEMRVQRIAEARNQAPLLVLREAVQQYVDREEKRQQFNADTLAALEDFEATGLHLTGEEVDEWLSKLAAGENAPMPECHT